MLVLPIEELPPELRDTYILLKGLQELPYELQSLILSHPDGYRDLLRLLKRVSHTTKEACMPFLHRKLSLPGGNHEASYWHSFMDVFPNMKRHCRILRIDTAALCTLLAFVKWSSLLPQIIVALPGLQALYLSPRSSCDYGPNLHPSILATISGLPTLRILRIGHATYGPVEDRRKMLASPRAAYLPRTLQIVWQDMHDLGILSLAFFRTQVLPLERVNGLGRASLSSAWLKTLIIDRCRDMTFSTLLNMLQMSSPRLAFLVCRQTMRESNGYESEKTRSLWSTVKLLQLEQLSFEIDTRPRRDQSDVTRAILQFHSYIQAPKLAVLGLGNLPSLVESSTISRVIEGRMTEGLASVSRPLTGLADEDEEEEALNPFSLFNQFARNKAEILSNSDYDKFYQSW